MNKISIKFTVVSLFLFLSALIVVSMLYVQYTFSQELVTKSIKNQVKLLSSKVEDKVIFMDKINSSIVTNVSSFLENKTIDEVVQNKEKYIKFFANILENNNDIYAVYIGFEKDGFFELINLNIDKKLREKYNAKYTDRWLYVQIIEGEQKLTLLNSSFKETSSSLHKSNYLSTTRVWYKKSVAENSVIKTKPYDFSNISGKGVTYAKSIGRSKNVFSIDLLINNLNATLEKYSEDALDNSYIVDKNKNIVASSSSKDNKIIEKIISLSKNEKVDSLFLNEVVVNNKQYIYSIVPLNSDYLYSYSDVDKIIASYNDKIQNMTVIMLVLLVGIIPIIFYFSSIIVKPILLLVDESIKVKNREFQEVKKIKSRVLEINQLSDSLTEMSSSICDYQTDLETKVKQRTLELAEKNKELQKLSVTDKLTGLYNRIKLDETLDNEKKRVERHAGIFGIIIIDIDFFKKVNDTYGHQAGDTILVEFAKLMENSVRKTDLLGRWGGEEFMIICTETNLENIISLAEKIRRKISSFDFPIVKHKTASFGVATFKKGENLEKMIDRADQALYIAKEKGRDRVETIEE